MNALNNSCCAVVLLIVAALALCRGASAAEAADPQRFFQVKEWAGAFNTGAQSSGTTAVAGDGVVTYQSSIRVEGRFKLTPVVDPRSGPAPVWRGTGEAHVLVSGKRTTKYLEELITDTYVGEYVDTINVEVTHIDVTKGTYQLSIVRELWQKQPHKGKAIELKSVKVNKYGTYPSTNMQAGHSWADDGGAGFGRPTPLPKEGLIIDGAITSHNNDYLSPVGSKWDTTWTIRPVTPDVPEPLKAVAGGPYVAVRGQTLNLDGWKSTGKIRSYKWAFEPADPKSTVPFNAGAAKEGQRVPTVLLAPVKATLTVSDGQKEDSDSVVIQVSARDYKTPLTHRPEEGIHPRSQRPRFIKDHDTSFVGGENVCALDSYGGNDAIHVLHPGDKAGSWKGNGFTTQQVKDPGGPFDGVWFVGDYTIRIERQSLINKYILPKGPAPVSTAKPFYDANKALGHEVDKYLDAVRKHEHYHTERIEEALPKSDPGPKIEALTAKDEASIASAADKAIQSAETTLSKATEDPLPKTFFEGKIAFPDDATDEYITFEMKI